MPLLKFDIIKGRTPEQVTQLLDATHEIIVKILNVPDGDRYQVVTQHEPYELILKDTGLGFKRSEQCVLLTIITKERPENFKEKLYDALSEHLQNTCRLAPEDLMISIVNNTDSDWSFGFGRAQFLTGEL